MSGGKIIMNPYKSDIQYCGGRLVIKIIKVKLIGPVAHPMM